jgi:acyl-CoA synthetase (AMP-forming)/AMP-acid ligase II
MATAITTPPQDCKTTPQLVEAAAATYGDKPFIEDEGQSISFAQFQQLCRTAAAGLHANGFEAGQRAAVWAPNMHQWIIAALAIQYAGGVLVTVNTRYKGAEAAAILNSGEVSVLFCIGDFLGDYYPQLLQDSSLPLLQEIIVFGQRAGQPHTDWDDFLARGRDYLAGPNATKVSQTASWVSSDDPADILFTSGTTGAPKGVVSQHQQNLTTFRLWTEILGLTEQDRYLVINPFFHSFGYKAGILACLLRGTTLLPHKVFDADEVMQRIQQQHITMLPGAPTLFQSMLASPRRAEFDLSTLNKSATGAATIAVELIKRMRSDLGIETVITAYGLSECCGLATMCRPGDSADLIANTSGRALPGVEVSCVDDQSQPLAAGEAGEILIRGFNVMPGYLNDPEATAEAIDANGWLHTGDVGHLDEAGNLTITDRLKDMFITGGFNCYPAEIENQLCDHPDISMAAVIGVPDERMGEVAMAWLVRNSGSALDEASLKSWCRQHMANYKVPRLFRFVDALPLNASGKVLKTELRSMVRQSN